MANSLYYCVLLALSCLLVIILKFNVLWQPSRLPVSPTTMAWIVDRTDTRKEYLPSEEGFLEMRKHRLNRDIRDHINNSVDATNRTDFFTNTELYNSNILKIIFNNKLDQTVHTNEEMDVQSSSRDMPRLHRYKETGVSLQESKISQGDHFSKESLKKIEYNFLKPSEGSGMTLFDQTDEVKRTSPTVTSLYSGVESSGSISQVSAIESSGSVSQTSESSGEIASVSQIIESSGEISSGSGESSGMVPLFDSILFSGSNSFPMDESGEGSGKSDDFHEGSGVSFQTVRISSVDGSGESRYDASGSSESGDQGSGMSGSFGIFENSSATDGLIKDLVITSTQYLNESSDDGITEGKSIVFVDTSLQSEDTSLQTTEDTSLQTLVVPESSSISTFHGTEAETEKATNLRTSFTSTPYREDITSTHISVGERMCTSANQCDTTLNERCITKEGTSICDCGRPFIRNLITQRCEAIVSLIGILHCPEEEFIPELNMPESEIYKETVQSARETLWLILENCQAILLRESQIQIIGFRSGSLVIEWQLLIPESIQNGNLTQIVADVKNGMDNVLRSQPSLLEKSPFNLNGATLLTLMKDPNPCERSICSPEALCIEDETTVGGYKCTCKSDSRDVSSRNPEKYKGENCEETCPERYCGVHGTCYVLNNQPSCSCQAWYIGERCQISGSVLGFSIGITFAVIFAIVILVVKYYHSRSKTLYLKNLPVSTTTYGSTTNGSALLNYTQSDKNNVYRPKSPKCNNCEEFSELKVL